MSLQVKVLTEAESTSTPQLSAEPPSISFVGMVALPPLLMLTGAGWQTHCRGLMVVDHIVAAGFGGARCVLGLKGNGRAANPEHRTAGRSGYWYHLGRRAVVGCAWG